MEQTERAGALRPMEIERRSFEIIDAELLNTPAKRRSCAARHPQRVNVDREIQLYAVPIDVAAVTQRALSKTLFHPVSSPYLLYRCTLTEAEAQGIQALPQAATEMPSQRADDWPRKYPLPPAPASHRRYAAS